MAYYEEMTNENSLSVGRVALIVALICLLVNLRALFCGFAPMDDHIYVQNNPALRSLDGNLLRWAFTAVPIDFWQPLTWISLALDYRLWKLNPSGYHFTNILLHAVNAALVVIIAGRLPKEVTAHLRAAGRPRYLYPFTLLLAGLLFGLHPLRVESVVWIAERKDVLSGLFFLGSILFYLEYGRRMSGEVAAPAKPYYLLSFGSFLLSLMTKPVCVVLPLMLLVLDWYPLERFKRDGVTRVLAEKIPFLLLSVAIALLTLYFGAINHILKPYGFLTVYQRLVVSGNAIFEYCRLLLIPLGINPFQLIVLPLPALWGFKAAAAGIACLLIFAAGKRRWLPTVWCCFLLPLLPVLAIFQNGEQALAARYTYLPSIALSIAVAVMTATLLADRWGDLFGKALLALIAAGLLYYAGMTFHLTRVWDNGETYWSRVVAMQPIDSQFIALAEICEAKGDYVAAVENYTRALERATGDCRRYIYNLYAFRGAAYRSLGRHAEAVRDFSTAITLSPHPVYYHARGLALRELGNGAAAAEDMRIAGDRTGEIAFWYKDPPADEIRRALELNPDDAEALNNRGQMYLRMNDPDRALPDLDRAIALQPGRYEFYWNRSTAFMKKGFHDRAMADCNRVLQLKPGSVDAYLRRAFILGLGNDPAAALQDLDNAVRLDPENSEAYANRGLILFRLGSGRDAIRDFTTALAKGPALAAVYYNRGLAYGAEKMPAEADADLRRAQDLGYPLSDAQRRKIVSGKR